MTLLHKMYITKLNFDQVSNALTVALTLIINKCVGYFDINTTE